MRKRGGRLFASILCFQELWRRMRLDEIASCAREVGSQSHFAWCRLFTICRLQVCRLSFFRYVVTLPFETACFRDGMEAQLARKAKKRAPNAEEAKTHVRDLSAAEARRLYSISVEFLELCTHVSSICVELLELCTPVSGRVDPEAGCTVAPPRDPGFEVRSINQAGNARVSSTGAWRCSAS
jgi:hypothetical protein